MICICCMRNTNFLSYFLCFTLFSTNYNLPYIHLIFFTKNLKFKMTRKKNDKLWLVDHKVEYKKFGSTFSYFAFWKSGSFKKCSMKVNFLKKLIV